MYSTGAIAPNEPSYWTVDPLSSSDKYLVVKGYGANGYYEQTLRSNFRIDVEGMIDPQSIYDGTASFDTIITNWQYLNGCSYFVAGDSVYWMNKRVKGGDPTDYEWEAQKVRNGSGVLSVDNRYTIITNNDQSAVYLIGVVGGFDVDVEAGTAAKGKNAAKIYTITTDRDGAELSCTLHGPLDLSFAAGEQVNCFTAAYNPEECRASGLTIAYCTPAPSQSRFACSIKMWKQNADRGMLVTDVRIPDYRIVQGQPTIEAFVTVRNYGYGRERPVSYEVHDGEGRLLMQTNGISDFSGESYTYSGAELYTGDTRVDKVLIRPDPDWSRNEEHEIVIEVVGFYKYTGSLDDVVNSAAMQADNISLTAKNTLIGGRYSISTSVTNNTLVGLEAPTVRIVPYYGEETENARTLQFRLPMRETLCGFDADDEDFTGQVYHFDVDMDDVWTEGLENGLLGAYVSLVDEDGKQLSNEVIFLKNPAREQSGGSVGSGQNKSAPGPAEPGTSANAGGKNAVLWAVPGAAGLLALIAAIVLIRKKRSAKQP